MKKLRVLIIDDEPLAREGMKILLSREPDMKVDDECSNGDEAVKKLRSAIPPDIVLLDIQMPGMDGFRVVEEIGVEHMPPVIFVTAFDEHAVRAFDVHAVDYVLKPVDPDRFSIALERGRRMRTETDLPKKLRTLLDSLSRAKPHLDRIMVRQPGKLTFIPVSEIEWIEAEGDYVFLHLHDRKVIVREKIGDLEGKLNPVDFARIHRSTIVRISRVKELQPAASGEHVVLLHDGTKLTLSRTYRDRFLSSMKFQG